jgi:hypothetical protein
MHFNVYLHEHEVKLVKHVDESGSLHWHETGKGESPLASALGKLIEEQQKEPLT